MYLFSTDNCRPLKQIRPETAVNPQTLGMPEVRIASYTPDGSNELPLIAGIPSPGGDVVFYSVCRENSPHCQEGLAYSSPITILLPEPGVYSISARSCVWNDRTLIKESPFEKRISQLKPDQLNCGLVKYSKTWTQKLISSSKKLNQHLKLINLKSQIHRHLYLLQPVLLSWLESGSKIPKYLSRQIENLLHFRDPLHSFIFQRHFWATLDMTRELLVAYSALSSKLPFSKGVMSPCASEREILRMQQFAYSRSSETSYFNERADPPDQEAPAMDDALSGETGSVREYLSSPKTLVALTILSMGGIVSLDDSETESQVLLEELQAEIHHLYHGVGESDSELPKYIVGVGVGHAVTNTFKLFRATFLSEKQDHEESNYHSDFLHINKLRIWSGRLLNLLTDYQRYLNKQPKNDFLQEPSSDY